MKIKVTCEVEYEFEVNEDRYQECVDYFTAEGINVKDLLDHEKIELLEGMAYSVKTNCKIISDIVGS